MNREKRLVGYTDLLSVAAGDRQRFMISSPGSFEATLVRPVRREESERSADRPVPWTAAGRYPGVVQTARPGSWGEVRNMPALPEFTIAVHFMPTRLSGAAAAAIDTPGNEITVLVGASGLGVSRAVGGSPTLLFAPLAVAADRWHWLYLACRDDQLQCTLIRHPGNVGERAMELSAATHAGGLSLAYGSWLLGARTLQGDREPSFNGRLESPWVAREWMDSAEALHLSEHPETLRTDSRIVAAWDFSQDIGSDRFVDVSPHQRRGTFFNTPTRAVRGFRWDGSEQDWTRAPSHYAAVHFHEDDLTDAQWSASVEWTVPEDLPSGIYAVVLTADADEDCIPFFVRPSPRHRRARAVFLVPTATYLAYANSHLSLHAALRGLTTMSEADAYLHAHPESGGSLYDRHVDGSGVHHSSYLRPVLNLKPTGRLWGFAADLNIAAWLHHSQIPFDVVTDEDLHREGGALLDGYGVVITGTHPEYASTRMLDALERHLAGGGRLMYMGGNGFYWRIAYHPHNPAVIELRRSEGRGRAWDADPGEYYHSFTGEYGGLWRLLGRPPNRLTGVGYVALAQDGSMGYQRQAGADDSRARFIFEGTREGAAFGGYGSVCGGAVSQEIDRANPLLGSPDHLLILASSGHPSSDFMLAREESDAVYPDSQGPKLRADMTFFETPTGGAVFATGSIGFAGALAHDGYENDVCRIATNVLTRFVDPTPSAYPANGKPAPGELPTVKG